MPAQPPPAPTSTGKTTITTPADPSGPDPFLVGRHCEYSYCRQLDFLPFRCPSCSGWYCQDHRTEDNHKCTQPGAWSEQQRRQASSSASSSSAAKAAALRDRHPVPPGAQCAWEPCGVDVSSARATGVYCERCARVFCLKYRLREDHACGVGSAQKLGGGDGIKNNNNNNNKLGLPENGMEAFRLRWNAVKKRLAVGDSKTSVSSAKGGGGGGSWLSKMAGATTKPPSPAISKLKRTNDLKRLAKGDQKLAQEKRVYVVVAGAEKNCKGECPKIHAFYSKDWVIGRLLDAAAKELNLHNINNKTEDANERLFVFHVEGEKFLEYSAKVGEKLQTGDRVVLVRGTVPPDNVIAMLLDI